MKYDFDAVFDRHDTNSVKWDLCPDREVIPMWVADMDFKAAPFIMDAVRKRVEHGIFGYTHVPESTMTQSSDGSEDGADGRLNGNGSGTFQGLYLPFPSSSTR